MTCSLTWKPYTLATSPTCHLRLLLVQVEDRLRVEVIEVEPRVLVDLGGEHRDVAVEEGEVRPRVEPVARLLSVTRAHAAKPDLGERDASLLPLRLVVKIVVGRLDNHDQLRGFLHLTTVARERGGSELCRRGAALEAHERRLPIAWLGRSSREAVVRVCCVGVGLVATGEHVPRRDSQPVLRRLRVVREGVA